MHSYEVMFKNRGGKEYRVVVNNVGSQLKALSEAMTKCGHKVPADVCEIDVTLCTPVDVI